MRSSNRQIALIATGLLAGLAACAQADGAGGRSDVSYQPVETRLLDGDLVNFRVGLSGSGAGDTQVAEYANCAAAQYALIRGYGFARHVRTNVEQEAGIWRADAVYTISPALPRGLRTIDAEVTVADCRDRGIPTV
ncbi:hypothetical protein BFP70_16975 [Thioclava sp. SK-1]|uniref:hypothetical protein n=1 Tax=Thioclava sp. SK-1 TaxID=1889770 RepID=UPI0008245121|nr:hypothetical protein [Thioclava sp. SK-1]OCX61136.1 hypothetical protein BFP70_16975 [Thioclava sp. SK-1]